MNGKPLVSVIVPCYNVENKISRLLESLLGQTFQNLEIFLINDGSTDQTAEVIGTYQKKFECHGMKIQVMHKENGGPGSAVNMGLKEVSGDYLIWPDADDWLSKDSIEIRVGFLEAHPEYAMLSCNAYVFFERDLSHPVSKIVKKVTKDVKNPNQFDLLLEFRSVFTPVCHMIRLSEFRKANPDMDIYEARRGQNFQMLMPIYFHRNRYFMDECLCSYVIYEDSLSRGDDSLEKLLVRQNEYEDIVCNTLERLDMSNEERSFYEDKIKSIHVKQNLHAAFVYGDRELLQMEYGKLKANHANSFSDDLKYLMGMFKLGNVLWHCKKFMKRCFSRLR